MAKLKIEKAQPGSQVGVATDRPKVTQVDVREKTKMKSDKDKPKVEKAEDTVYTRMPKWEFKKVPEMKSIPSCRFTSNKGYVQVGLTSVNMAKDEIVTSSTALTSGMCLTQEQVRGQKIETEQVIADGSMAANILPGAVVNLRTLLNTGQFNYINFNKRKPIFISTSSNLFQQTQAEISPNGNNSIESKLRSEVNRMKSPANLINPNAVPNAASNVNAQTSTLLEKTGIDIGASFFYLGASASEQFSFSSEKYRYMYLYQFEQACLSIIANGITGPADVFTDNSNDSDWFYIKEVKYGRRLYVLIESEYNLEEYANELQGSLNWLVVSGKFTEKNTGSSFYSKTNIRVLTQGGSQVHITSPADLKTAVDNYQNKKFSEIEIVPLSYKITHLDGKPASLLSCAFLDSQNCLNVSKVRVRIKSVQCINEDDGGGNEEIYGGVAVWFYNAQGKHVWANGTTVFEVPPEFDFVPTGIIKLAGENAPLVLSEVAGSKVFSANQQDKYLDLSIQNLDMTIELRPSLKEQDDFGDDTFITNNRFKKSIRQMLMDGSSVTIFEFRHDESVVELITEIVPLY